MFNFLTNVGVLGITAAIAWWLSGFDSKVRGENLREDYTRRGIRCGLTLVIVEISYLALRECLLHDDRPAGILYLATFVPLILLWISCITEALAQAFRHMVDPPDNRAYDPKKDVRELDAVGDLIRSGRKEEAIALCRMLLETSDDNRAALEMTLHHLGAPVESFKESKPLADAHRLQQAGKYTEAETILKSLLRAHPADTGAALMLMRLYVLDMHSVDKASGVLRSLEKQPHVSSAHVEFARRSLEDWQKPRTEKAAEEPEPESIEEMLAKGYYGTAVEILEKKAEDEPGNFDVWFKLAEVEGKYCANLRMAEKMVRRIEGNPAFSAEQIKQARSKLQEWRSAVTGAK